MRAVSESSEGCRVGERSEQAVMGPQGGSARKANAGLVGEDVLTNGAV